MYLLTSSPERLVFAHAIFSLSLFKAFSLCAGYQQKRKIRAERNDILHALSEQRADHCIIIIVFLFSFSMDLKELYQLATASPVHTAATAAVALTLNATLQYLLRPRNHPPFYCEFPYIPWLGSLVQFATQPREFLERAASKCGNVFTIHLFGKKMTFLMGTDGHGHFFRTKEHVFDIREAYAMTVTTFGPKVCYDVPQSRMAEVC